MGIEAVFPHKVFTIGNIAIRDTVFQTWIVVALLMGFALWGSRRLSLWHPRLWQSVVEYLYEYVENLVRNTVGRSIPDIVPYLTTMIAFVAIANLLGAIPTFQAPTRDINTTIALSVISFGSCQIMGTRQRGLGGYLKSLAEPSIMLPINLMGFLSRIMSMSLRLFGNILAGEVIGAVMFLLVPVVAPLVLNALGMLTSVLQALVFTVLTLVFIVDAMGEEEPVPPLHTDPAAHI